MNIDSGVLLIYMHRYEYACIYACDKVQIAENNCVLVCLIDNATSYRTGERVRDAREKINRTLESKGHTINAENEARQNTTADKPTVLSWRHT